MIPIFWPEWLQPYVKSANLYYYTFCVPAPIAMWGNATPMASAAKVRVSNISVVKCTDCNSLCIKIQMFGCFAVQGGGALTLFDWKLSNYQQFAWKEFWIWSVTYQINNSMEKWAAVKLVTGRPRTYLFWWLLLQILERFLEWLLLLCRKQRLNWS